MHAYVHIERERESYAVGRLDKAVALMGRFSGSGILIVESSQVPSHEVFKLLRLRN